MTVIARAIKKMNLFARATNIGSRQQRLAGAAHPLHIPAVAATRAHDRLPATVLAVSPLDIRLTMDANPDRGETITVSVSPGSTDDAVTMTGIVHWTEMRGSEHEVGIFLTQTLPVRLRHLQSDPQRSSERYRCRISGVLSWGRDQPECSAIAVNYAHSGLALQCAATGVIDEVFTFRWLDNGVLRSVTGVALWQIEQNGTNLIGCQLEPGDGCRIAGLSNHAAVNGS
ncbi:MAG: hypothetical protein RIK87_22480 [Fuerstiella sp.]